MDFQKPYKLLKWDREKVENFWNAISRSPLSELYFSKLAGNLVIDYIEPWLKQDFRILDFGSGTGSIAKLLLEKGYFVAIYDSSEENIQQSYSELKNYPNFLGIDGDTEKQYDVILLFEVIEHVLKEELKDFMSLLYNKLNENGLLICTTPNHEKLEHNYSYCPSCEHFFHRWQHQRNFTNKSLVKLFFKNKVYKRYLAYLDFSSERYQKRKLELYEDIVSNLKAIQINSLDDKEVKSLFEKLIALRYKNDFFDEYLESIKSSNFNYRIDYSLGNNSTIFFVGIKKSEDTYSRNYFWYEIKKIFSSLQQNHNLHLETGEIIIPKEKIYHEEGFCYKFFIPELKDLADDSLKNFGANLSPILLYEDSVRLSHPHSPHADIRNIGNGRYSHWDGEIYFSSSDNSSPKTNKKTYKIKIRGWKRFLKKV